jgi:hypothetical protein
MDINQIISDFIRDAQYRIAEIATTLDQLSDKEEPEYKTLKGYRDELYSFMDVLYVGEYGIIDGYNHLDWDDYTIQAECEYLRNRTGMVTSPFASFVLTYPEIIAYTGANEIGGSLPAGDPNDFLYYGPNAQATAVPFPTFVGMVSGDTVLSYFS